MPKSKINLKRRKRRKRRLLTAGKRKVDMINRMVKKLRQQSPTSVKDIVETDGENIINDKKEEKINEETSNT